MTGRRQVETERKYDVGPTAEMPDLQAAGVAAAVRRDSPEELTAVYFDTAGLDLLHAGYTLRRRQGGVDEGWHLKEPAGGDTRVETRLPLGRAVHTPPKPLREAVEAVTGGRPLLPVATVVTRRTRHELVRADASCVAVVCQDEVRAERLQPPALRQHWREWEVELSEDAPSELLDLVEPVLLSAGARRSGHRSKLARALAEDSPARETFPRASELRPRRSSAADALGAYLAQQVEVLRQHDSGLHGETVHRLRIAARRARSALTTYRPLFTGNGADALRDELRWLGTALGDARDLEVLGAHFEAVLADDGGYQWARALDRLIREEMGRAHEAAHTAAVGVVASERFSQLVRSVEAVVVSADLTPAAFLPAREVLPGLLERDARRLRRVVKTARQAPDGTARDRALHEVRKKAKRLRYAAESATPVLGERARTLATRAKAVQDSLGAHQDSVASRAWLSGLVERSAGDPFVPFGAGRLYAGEEQRARDARQAYAKAIRRLPARRVDRWVRKGG